MGFDFSKQRIQLVCAFNFTRDDNRGQRVHEQRMGARPFRGNAVFTKFVYFSRCLSYIGVLPVGRGGRINCMSL